MEAVFALPEVTRAVVAEALGYISIGFWLFAQAPYVHADSCQIRVASLIEI
jgi:hypothetical protein